MSRVRTQVSKLLGLMVFAAAIIGADASEASASVTVCNNYSKTILWTATINDAPGCSGSWRERGWWAIGPNQCRVLNGIGDMTGKTIYHFARAYDNSKQWSGPSQYTWSVPNGTHDGCYTSIQSQCSTFTSQCRQRSHRQHFSSSSNIKLDFW